ncbi:hypothetical protein P691DRAFT_685041, partial [Macrolepiota fuliginosa MF-IS2]
IVLEILYQEMTKGADVDSSVQWPQPKCYPGTCVRLMAKIQDWFLHNSHNYNFLWLSGPAGIGKSAMAQSVAKFAIGEGILGAVYFFSRPNKWHKYMEVFIILAYQLTIRFPGYQSLITTRLAAEPDLLEKMPHVQFRKLIVEPLLLLSHKQKHIIIFNGLDECEGEGNQLEIIELINSLHSNTSLPIIWMICSQLEPHLKQIFAQTDYPIQCWQEVLPIQLEESRSDTETFIRGQFKEIHKIYGKHVEEDADGCWLLETSIKQIVEKASGLFMFANMLLRHIKDSETGNPDERLEEVLAFLWHLHPIDSRNPMYDLDLFYTHILSVIPGDHWSIIHQILVASPISSSECKQLAVQPICNLLGITRTKFYAVMWQLHSVIDIPEPFDATKTPLHFFHATFLDYLTKPNHSGQFFVGKLVTDYDITIMAGFWDLFLSGLRCLGSTVGLSLIERHEKEVRGNQEVSQSLNAALSWPSVDVHANWESAEEALWVFRYYFFEFICILLKHSNLDDQLLGVLHSFDSNVLAFVLAPHPWLIYSPPRLLGQLVNPISHNTCLSIPPSHLSNRK